MSDSEYSEVDMPINVSSRPRQQTKPSAKVRETQQQSEQFQESGSDFFSSKSIPVMKNLRVLSNKLHHSLSYMYN